MAEIISPPTLVEQVYDAVVSEIVEGKLPPGSRLIQDELASAYGVSRQPIQQALLLLRRHGLITDAPRRGLIVTPLAIDFVENLYEIRASLEGLAARRAAERGRERAGTDGPALIEQGRLAVSKRRLADEIRADMDFHAFVYELSGNPLILETVGPQRQHMRRVMAAVLRDGQSIPGTIWDEHAAILAAIASGDGGMAERLAREHIERAAAIFVDRLRRRQEEEVVEEQTRSRRRRLAGR